MNPLPIRNLRKKKLLPIRSSTAGVFLLEVMIAVGIFALGVLAIGRSLSNCLEAQKIRSEDMRATQILENKMSEIIANSSLPDVSLKEKLEGPYAGFTFSAKRKTLDFKNEQNINLSGLYQIDLQVEWKSSGTFQSRNVSFFLLRMGI